LLYDILAQRYCYTLDEFYNLTNRQLFVLLEMVSKNKFKEMEFKASLAGRELKESSFEGSNQSNEELDKAAAKSMEKFIKERKQNG